MQFNRIKLSTDNGHYFFGYYDRCPWDNGERYHLALKVDLYMRFAAVSAVAFVPFPTETAAKKKNSRTAENS